MAQVAGSGTAAKSTVTGPPWQARRVVQYALIELHARRIEDLHPVNVSRFAASVCSAVNRKAAKIERAGKRDSQNVRTVIPAGMINAIDVVVRREDTVDCLIRAVERAVLAGCCRRGAVRGERDIGAG